MRPTVPALALTASTALAAPPPGSSSNPAQMEHVESAYPDGSSYEGGETCRSSSQTVTANGETRMQNSQSSC